MNNITASVILSFLRHIITLVGGVVFATKHESELVNLAGLLAALIPALFGAWKARRDMKMKDDLAAQVAVAEDKTAYLAHQATKKP